MTDSVWISPHREFPWICHHFLSLQCAYGIGASGVGTDYQLDTADTELHRSTFDLTSYLSKTSASAAERLQRQLQAKEAQITSRVELYEEQVDRLWTEIDRQCDELEHLQNKMCRTAAEEERVAEKLSHLYGELREPRQRFHQELRELEDERIALQQELDSLDDRQELVALAGDWL